MHNNDTYNWNDYQCTGQCSSTQFQCSSGQCVSFSLDRCDGFRDCLDGSDERSCSKFPVYFDSCMLTPATLTTSLSSYYVTFECYSVICAASCQSGAFRCNNAQCVRSSDRCDGSQDCTDGSDESGCTYSKPFRYLGGIHTLAVVDDVCVVMCVVVSFPDPPPKRKGGSGEYSTTSHYGLAVAMDSAKSQAFEVSCWASVN